MHEPETDRWRLHRTEQTRRKKDLTQPVMMTFYWTGISISEETAMLDWTGPK